MASPTVHSTKFYTEMSKGESYIEMLLRYFQSKLEKKNIHKIITAVMVMVYDDATFVWGFEHKCNVSSPQLCWERWFGRF